MRFSPQALWDPPLPALIRQGTSLELRGAPLQTTEIMPFCGGEMHLSLAPIRVQGRCAISRQHPKRFYEGKSA